MAEQEQAADIASARDKEEYIQRQFRRGQLLGIFALLMTPKAGLSKADALILRVGEPGVGAVAPVFVPAWEGGAVFRDVGDAPAQAALVEVGGDGVVGAKDVEVTGVDAGDHAVYDLVGGPGAGGLGAVGCFRHTGEGPPRNEQVRRDTIAGFFAKGVGELFCQRTDAGLGDCVSGIAGRVGDALFGAGVDDGATVILRQHGRHETVDAIDDAPKVDVDGSVPSVEPAGEAGTATDGGVVHQDRDCTERAVGSIVQFGDVLRFGHIAYDDACFNRGGNLRCERLQRILADVE